MDGQCRKRACKGKARLRGAQTSPCARQHPSQVPPGQREISRSRSLWTTWRANGSHAGKARLGGLRFA